MGANNTKIHVFKNDIVTTMPGTGILHSFNDEPSIVNTHHKIWTKNNKLHRDTLDEKGELNPAVMYDDGRKQWWIDGKIIKTNYTTKIEFHEPR
jgi:hypothetical protein